MTSQNPFSASMKKQSDDWLLQCLKNKEKFDPVALQAAKMELEKRGIDPQINVKIPHSDGKKTSGIAVDSNEVEVASKVNEQPNSSESFPIESNRNVNKEIHFLSPIFYKFITFFIIALLVVNGINIIANITSITSDPQLLSGISLLGLILYCLYVKHRWTKILLLIWSTLLILVGFSQILSTLSLIDYYFFDSIDTLNEISWVNTIAFSPLFFLGLVILILTLKYVRVIDIEKK